MFFHNFDFYFFFISEFSLDYNKNWKDFFLVKHQLWTKE